MRVHSGEPTKKKKIWDQSVINSLLEQGEGRMEEASKLFQLPGTIEEEEMEERRVEKLRESLENARAASPLLGPKGLSVPSNLTRNVTLIRVSTQSSSIAGGIGRQDSNR